MGTWDHRVMVRPNGFGGSWLTIHEVHYDEDKRILAWTVEPVGPDGEDAADLRAGYLLMGTALRKPHLEIRGEDLYEDGVLVYDHTAPHPWDALADRVKAAKRRREKRKRDPQ